MEEILAHGRPLGGTDTFLDGRQQAMAFVREMGWDPNRGCIRADDIGEAEAEARRIAVDRILDEHVPDRETGVPRPEDVSDHDDILITTLLQGAGKVVTVPTVSEAFDFRLKEKQDPDPHERRTGRAVPTRREGRHPGVRGRHPADRHRPHAPYRRAETPPPRADAGGERLPLRPE